MNRIIMLRGVLTTLALSTAVAFAQPSHKGQGRHHGQHAEARKALKTYVESNVLPVVSPLREAFDENLSNAELQELADIRQDLKALRDAHKEARKEFRQQHTPGERPEPTEEQRAQMQQAAKERRHLMTRTWAIADAHEAELNDVFATLRPQAKTWRDEMRELMQEYRPEGSPDREPRGPREAGEARPQKGHHGRRPHKGGMRGGHLRQLQSPVGFLLWEPGADLFEAEAPARTLEAFPNPATESVNIRFENSQPGSVTVRLVSETGNPVKTLYTGKVVEGAQSLSLDLTGIESGTYMLQVLGPDGPQTTKIVKE